MSKKTVVSLIVVAGLLVVGVAAFAHGPGFGRGNGDWGRGPGMTAWGPGNGLDDKAYQETAKLRNDLYQKHQELRAVLAAPQVDEAKAKALQADINKLRNELSDKVLAARIEFKKKNPDMAQGYGSGYGPGWGRGNHMGYDRGTGYGPGMGYGRGMGNGPGACWQ